MSNNPVIRPLRLPPSDFAQIKVPKTRLPARHWYRVHQAQYQSVHFSLNAGHRFSHPKCPYPFLYLGADIDTCLFERFGGLLYQQSKSINASLWQANHISTVEIPGLQVCDLTASKTLSALMVDLSSLMHNDVSTPQEWGLAIQQHPAAFQAIKFESRFNGKPCLALFQRDDIEKHLCETADEPLIASEAAVNWLHKHEIRAY